MAKKSLGQHFLRCQWVADTMVKAAQLTPWDTVLEIGPGTGALTMVLAQTAKEVLAVEKDERLAFKLQQRLEKEKTNNVRVVSRDILQLLKPRPIKSSKNLSKSDFDKFLTAPKSYKVIAAIPYYLTSRLLRLLLENGPRPEQIVFTVQEEVAKRIGAHPPHMNLLALSVQAFGTPEIIKKVPASCFSPMPKIDSAIIKISDISDRFFQENHIAQEDFFALVRLAFSKKRKLLTNSLGQVAGKQEIMSILKETGLSDTARPEELTLPEWARLLSTLKTASARIPNRPISFDVS